MASAGRRSELQALVFDLQFKLKGAGVKLYFTPEFMRKIRGLTWSVTRRTSQRS